MGPPDKSDLHLTARAAGSLINDHDDGLLSDVRQHRLEMRETAEAVHDVEGRLREKWVKFGFFWRSLLCVTCLLVTLLLLQMATLAVRLLFQGDEHDVWLIQAASWLSPLDCFALGFVFAIFVGSSSFAIFLFLFISAVPQYPFGRQFDVVPLFLQPLPINEAIEQGLLLNEKRVSLMVCMTFGAAASSALWPALSCARKLAPSPGMQRAFGAVVVSHSLALLASFLGAALEIYTHAFSKAAAVLSGVVSSPLAFPSFFPLWNLGFVRWMVGKILTIPEADNRAAVVAALTKHYELVSDDFHIATTSTSATVLSHTDKIVNSNEHETAPSGWVVSLTESFVSWLTLTDSEASTDSTVPASSNSFSIISTNESDKSSSVLFSTVGGLSTLFCSFVFLFLIRLWLKKTLLSFLERQVLFVSQQQRKLTAHKSVAMLMLWAVGAPVVTGWAPGLSLSVTAYLLGWGDLPKRRTVLICCASLCALPLLMFCLTLSMVPNIAAFACATSLLCVRIMPLVVFGLLPRLRSAFGRRSFGTANLLGASKAIAVGWVLITAIVVPLVIGSIAIVWSSHVNHISLMVRVSITVGIVIFLLFGIVLWKCVLKEKITKNCEPSLAFAVIWSDALYLRQRRQSQYCQNETPHTHYDNNNNSSVRDSKIDSSTEALLKDAHMRNHFPQARSSESSNTSNSDASSMSIVRTNEASSKEISCNRPAQKSNIQVLKPPPLHSIPHFHQTLPHAHNDHVNSNLNNTHNYTNNVNNDPKSYDENFHMNHEMQSVLSWCHTSDRDHVTSPSGRSAICPKTSTSRSIFSTNNSDGESVTSVSRRTLLLRLFSHEDTKDDDHF